MAKKVKPIEITRQLSAEEQLLIINKIKYVRNCCFHLEWAVESPERFDSKKFDNTLDSINEHVKVLKKL